MDSTSRSELGLELGDTVEIVGKRSVVAKVFRCDPEDEGRGMLFIDGLTRTNAGVSVDESVTVRRCVPQPAEQITLAPNIPEGKRTRFEEGIESMFLKGLMNRPLIADTDIIVPNIALMGNRSTFAVVSTVPKGPVIVGPRTKIVVKDTPRKQPQAKSQRGNQITYDDVGGLDEELKRIREMIELPLKHPELFERLGIGAPRGVLLYGPPGTGKTLMAEAVANESGASLFSVRGPEIIGQYYGQSEERLREIFKEAEENAPSIVFLDEIDSIGMKRTGAGALGGNHAYEQTLNTLLVEMDGFDANEGVIVIAATNRPDTLDAALLRPGRFDRQVIVDLPTLKGREEILRLHGKKIKFAPDVNLNRIARGTPGFSGADLANLLNEAALLAVRKGLAAVNQATLDEARDKVIWGSERKSAGYSRHDREITAWHESGHALLQLLLAHTDPLHKVTIIPRGRALGATMSLPEQDVLNRTRAQFLDEIVVMCGGRIAEEMFTGDISTGAAQDLAMATDTALKMVCSYGMCDKFGFRTFRGTSPFASENLPPAFSDETRRAVDAEVSEIVHKAYAQADELLKANRDKLEKLAETLLDKESMDGRDVAALLGLPFRDDPGEDKADEKKPAEAEKPAEAGAARPAEDAKPADEVADADKEEKPGA